MSEDKWTLTRIDCYWVMTRVEDGKVAFRKLRFYEKNRYFWQRKEIEMNWIKRFLGLKGSWGWACRQLDKGCVIYRTNDTGAAKYRLDSENQRRIQWAYSRAEIIGDLEWKNAYIFLADFECTNWEVWND